MSANEYTGMESSGSFDTVLELKHLRLTCARIESDFLLIVTRLYLTLGDISILFLLKQKCSVNGSVNLVTRVPHCKCEVVTVGTFFVNIVCVDQSTRHQKSKPISDSKTRKGKILSFSLIFYSIPELRVKLH